VNVDWIDCKRFDFVHQSLAFDRKVSLKTNLG